MSWIVRNTSDQRRVYSDIQRPDGSTLELLPGEEALIREFPTHADGTEMEFSHLQIRAYPNKKSKQLTDGGA